MRFLPTVVMVSKPAMPPMEKSASALPSLELGKLAQPRFFV